MDVKSAFIHVYIHEEIYMNQPKGYISDPTLVCKLQKSLYGLKHAPRSWYAKMDAFLLSQDFLLDTFPHLHDPSFVQTADPTNTWDTGSTEQAPLETPTK